MNLENKSPRPNRFETAVRNLAAVLSVYYLLAAAGVVLSRIGYRYELEFMEGASLIQVQRILGGQALYVKPMLEYIPMIYTPLYFYFSALVARLTGLSFFPLRLVSALASAGSSFLIYQFTREQTGSKRMGLIACGLFSATFALSGTWYDIARVDMLSLFFCLAAIYVFPRKHPSAPFLAGLLLALAFFTKQNNLLICAALIGYSLLFERRKAIGVTVTFGLLAAAAVLVANDLTAGWFNYFVFELPSTHQLVFGYIPSALVVIFLPFCLAFLVGLAPLIFDFRQSLRREPYRYCLVMTAGVVASSLLGAINKGGYKNVLIPAFAMAAILAVIGLEQTRISLANVTKRKINLAYLSVALLAQLGLLFYNPLALTPTQADQLAGDKLVGELKATPGEVLIPYHNYLASYAGKTVYFHQIAYEELRGTFSTRPASEWEAVYDQLVAADFTGIYLDLPNQTLEQDRCLTPESVQYDSLEAFLPVTGGRFRPVTFYRPCQQ
jgi:hypothetical protein